MRVILTDLSKDKRGRLYGDCNTTTGVIRISLKEDRVPLAKTYLHELIHHYCPWLSESVVAKAENALWRKMNARQRYILWRDLFKRARFK